MSQIITTDSLTYPITDTTWDQPLFPTTLNMVSFTPDIPHYAHDPSLPYSVNSIDSTSSRPANDALRMSMSSGIPPEDSQLCLTTHQVFELPLTSHTPAIPLASTSNNTQFESHRENMPQAPSRDFSVSSTTSGRLRGSHYTNMVSHGMVDNHSLPPDDRTVPYLLPNIDQQAISVQGQLNAPVNQGHGVLGYAPQHFALGAAQDGFNFPDPIVPSPGQLAKEDLRLLAIRYLCHPGSRVDMGWMEPSAGGQRKVVIMLEMPDVFVVTPQKIDCKGANDRVCSGWCCRNNPFECQF